MGQKKFKITQADKSFVLKQRFTPRAHGPAEIRENQLMIGCTRVQLSVETGGNLRWEPKLIEN